MAFEVLVRRRNNDKRSDLAKRGDIVAIGGNNHPWGRRESLEAWVAEGRDARDFPDEFVLLKVVTPDETDDQGRDLYRWRRVARKIVRRGERIARRAADHDDLDEDEMVTEHKFVWRVRFNELPGNWRRKQNNRGFVRVTLDEFVAATEHKMRRKRMVLNVLGETEGADVPDSKTELVIDPSEDADERLGAS